ncbi:MAG: DNA recombination protein RmuC [Parachlamydiales bacterium]|jgi:DNA recombination protein RmuC
MGLVLVFLAVLTVVLIFFFSFKNVQKRLKETFKALSYDLLEKNQNTFLQMAGNYFSKQNEINKQTLEEKEKALSALVEPLKSSLAKMHDYSNLLEKQREVIYTGLSKQIENLLSAEHLLRLETANLSRALKSPNVRGAWGQLHLKRVVELSGMLENCDFFQQPSVLAEGERLRPDLIVRLPNQRQLIIDAKTPMESYLEAQEEKSEEKKREKLKAFVRSLKEHIRSLASKEYFKLFQPTPEYVVLFLPLEALLSTALEMEPALLEEGVKNNVLLATPTTLIALLRAVAYSWRQEKLSHNAFEIAKAGKELYERLFFMQEHLQKVGRGLSQAVESYNGAVGSFNSRVLVSARRLKELGAGSEKEEKSLEEVVKKPLGPVALD